jgi:hypothetical protein
MSSKGKQYKNVYTILEKVKKGEIQTQSYYKDKDGLFGKINFYKKADLVKPYIHYIDEGKIDSLVRKEIQNQKSITEYFNRFKTSSAFGRLPEDQKPDLQKFHQKLQENYEKIPKSLKYDIHKLYYHKMDKLEFTERDEKNATRFKFLEKANNPVGKIMSEGSNLKSAVFAKNMMLYYLMQLTQMEYVDAQAQQQMMNGLNGNDDAQFNQDDIDDAMKKHMESTPSKNMLEKLMQDAQDTCKMMDEHIDQDVQEKMFDQANKDGGETAGKLSPDYMRQIVARLESVKLSMGSLKEKIKQLLDKSASYFSSRKIVKYEDLFNAQDVSGLEDYELLHPRLRKIFAEDIQIKDTKSVGKVDVYVDASGSMSSSCGVRNAQGSQISKIDFAKSMIAKLREMDMLNDVYLFDTRVKKYRNDMISISMIDCGGGTTINEAVRSIVRNDINALVITDAEDSCSIYSDKAFFIGVEGSRFNGFSHDVIQQYSNKNQVVVFDGHRIQKVDAYGVAMR